MNGKAWHILFSLAAEWGYQIRQFDISNAFLHGNLDERIYIEQPHGFVQDPSLVCKLRKSLYGLKQAANVWFKELVDILLHRMGFKQLQSDIVVFTKDVEGGRLMIGGHVDDLLAIAPSEKALNDFQQELAKHLRVKHGDLDTFLGVQARQNLETGTITIHQKRKVVDLLTEFGMLDSRPVSTPMQPNIELSRADCPTTEEERQGIDQRRYRSGVGSLMHIMVMTRPDICAAVKVLSEALDNPSHKHVDALKWLLRYLNGTQGYGITYLGHSDPRQKGRELSLELHGYYDADWARDVSDRKSRCGFVFSMSGGVVSWWSGKQEVVATSTVHAEYIGQDYATRELMWIQQFLKELGLPAREGTKVYGHMGQTPPTLYGDNQGAQALARNPVHHKLTKHIDIKHHFIREQLAKKVLTLVYCPSQKNVADIMTKPLQRVVFERHREAMGMTEVA